MDDDTRRTAGGSGSDGEGRPSWREAELQRLVADIAARLRKSCAHLPDDEFAKLVLDIAQRRMRFDGIDPTGETGRGSRR